MGTKPKRRAGEHVRRIHELPTQARIMAHRAPDRAGRLPILLRAYSVQKTNIGSIKECEVHTHIYAEKSSNRDGPASHKDSLLLFYMHRYSDCGTEGPEAMRVICGKISESTLAFASRDGYSPTSDRLRETLFNVLTAGNPAALEGSVWLDLFAGTGAIGIEALSRGAKAVHFVESSPSAANMIRTNLHSLGVKEGFKILEDELPRAFWRMERQQGGCRCGIYRSALPDAGCLRENAECARRIVFDMGNVGGDRGA